MLLRRYRLAAIRCSPPSRWQYNLPQSRRGASEEHPLKPCCFTTPSRKLAFAEELHVLLTVKPSQEFGSLRSRSRSKLSQLLCQQVREARLAGVSPPHHNTISPEPVAADQRWSLPRKEKWYPRVTHHFTANLSFSNHQSLSIGFPSLPAHRRLRPPSRRHLLAVVDEAPRASSGKREEGELPASKLLLAMTGSVPTAAESEPR